MWLEAIENLGIPVVAAAAMGWLLVREQSRWEKIMDRYDLRYDQMQREHRGERAEFLVAIQELKDAVKALHQEIYRHD